ncbi:proton-coupled folate transporter-like isoform X1 [Mytilus edulis]|uniref:proton-coupled folate transporter-like isoform X1 n=1 Tax=Mytilus edulis TaxID=6550 RepID=UPI0039F04B03
MDFRGNENEPLLKVQQIPQQQRPKWIGTRVKVMTYAMINTIALLIAGSAQTQYIYAYVKQHDATNNSTTKSNKSESKNVSKTCDVNGTSDDKIQAISADWSWYITLAEYGIAIPFIIFIGPMVDRIGRKPVLLWNLSLMTLSFAVKTLTIYFKLNLYYFLVGFAIEGLSGTFSTFSIASCALLADTTSKGNDRTIVMVIYDAVIGLGAFISFIGTGYLIEFTGFIYPFAISGGIFFFFTILVAITLDDSLVHRETTSRIQVSVFLGQIFSLCTKVENISRGVSYILIYLLIFFIYNMPSSGSITTIFTLSSPFCWSSEKIGWFSAVSSIVVFVGGTAILKILQTCFKNIKDELVVIFGLLSSVASYIIFGLSTTDHMIYESAGVGILKILPTPLIKAILSRAVHQDKQGALFSNIYLLDTVCTIFGSTLFNNIYHHTVTLHKGFVFFVMAGFPFIALVMMIFVTCKTYSTRDPVELDIDNPQIQNSDTPS